MQRAVAVLGDMLELGPGELEEHAQLGIQGQDVDPAAAELYNLGASRGALVVMVVPDSGAEAADAVILADDPTRLADAIEISRRTLRLARQSIWVGLGLIAGFSELIPVLGPILGAIPVPNALGLFPGSRERGDAHRRACRGLDAAGHDPAKVRPITTAKEA